MSVLTFKDVDEVIDRANNTISAWPPPSGRATSARPIAWPPSVRAGTVWVNCYDVFDAAAPFGGFKMSGMGRELGEARPGRLHRDEDGDGEFGVEVKRRPLESA